MRTSTLAVTTVLAAALAVAAPPPAHATPRTFPTGSLVIPMDLAYQDTGLLQAYGLLFQLLRQGVPVAWVIDPAKTWHAAPCDTVGDLCAWDCAIEGSGVKCPYPTASPDFFVGSTVVWSASASPGTTISNHGYRGGPFVIDAAHAAAARPIIDAWNDPARWNANPWARRTVFQVVTVHETTAPVTGFVSRQLVAAPTIAVFSDGNEDIATRYLRAAGIPQSNGSEFPANRCGASNCGPGTANPDMLTVPSIMGDMGTCDAPNLDHKNGSLFTADGLPAYCQIMSMHWNVADRETVQCGGGNCPATPAQCAGVPITYHGHEVVAEVRKFLEYPTHFFAECQAVNAYENTTPNPAWPYLDDDARDGHFLTTTGTPPACPCTDADFQCVVGGCNGADCCLPRDARERGAGFMIADRPTTIQVLSPEVPYNQLDGRFETIGGSEPAYNLSTYLGTMYKNDREVTFITGPSGPGVQDVWMTGYVDGECDISPPIGLEPPGDGAAGGASGWLAGPASCGGKVSYLGGHAYSTNVPISANPQSQGARLFLNALFEADCVSSVGQPAISLSLTGPLQLAAPTLPAEAQYTASYLNGALGPALDAVLREQLGDGVELVTAPGGDVDGATITWTIGSIGGTPGVAGDPPSSGGRPATLRFAAYGDYQVTIAMSYRAGVSILEVPPQTITIQVRESFPGDGDAGDGGDGGGDRAGGCCQGSPAAPSLALALGVLALALRRRAAPAARRRLPRAR
ncbi:MAG: hypothetical protein KJZ91_16555 [Myxococcales bacterium]|nr:hypothetical protein [Myxococcales bacterium]